MFESKIEAETRLENAESNDDSVVIPAKLPSQRLKRHCLNAKLSTIIFILFTIAIIVVQNHWHGCLWNQFMTRDQTVLEQRPGAVMPKTNFEPRCRPEDVTIRREWSTMPFEDRTVFSSAVNCLYDRPSKLDPTIYPGAQNRYDDFVALHINMTFVIHLSGLFLPWHRHFLWLWVEALRNECGYKGDVPYWQWEKYASDIHNNLLFDGSDGSMSGDGLFDGLNRTGPDAGFPRGPLSRGDGGGCLKSGPFKGRMLNFGPYPWSLVRADKLELPADWADWRPRCLSRDLSPAIAQINHNHTIIKNLLEKPQNLAEWLDALQGDQKVSWLEANPHAAGHFVVGGAGSDFFASPGDPTFYLHHSNVDRVWAQWVARDPEHRQYALYGTHTTFNKPPSPPVTMEETLDLGREDDGATVIKNVLDRTVYCYRYDDE